MNSKKLYRSCKDKVLGGVAGGLGEYFEVDATLIRLVIALLFLSGVGFVAYLLAWIIIPMDPSCENSKTGAEEIEEKAEKVANEVLQATKKGEKKVKSEVSDLRFWAGLILVIWACGLLFQNISGISLWHDFWPVVFVFLGAIMIAKSLEKK